MPNYPNPPITEAILEIRVTVPAGLDFSDLQNLPAEPKKYPTVSPRQIVETTFDTQGENSPITKKTPAGFFFTSEDGKQVIQASDQTLSFSRLNPYLGWDKFLEEATILWENYKRIVRPTAVERVGLRFINRLDLPYPFDDFKEYLRTVPEVSPDMSQILNNFLMVIESPQEDLQARLRISEALMPSPSETHVSVMLDIDLYRTESLDCDDAIIWGILSDLRHRKNRIFEACITDKTRELFK